MDKSHPDGAKISLASLLELFLLAALWGGSFVLLRVASPVFGPILLVELRVFTGLVVMFPFLFIYQHHHELFKHWRTIALISLINMCIPFCLLAFSSLSLGAGLISILNATVPFFAALTGFLAFAQKFSYAAMSGLLIGFMGVVTLVLSGDASLTINGNLLAFLTALLAASLYGLSTNIINQRLMGVSGLAITVGSLFFSTLFLLPFIFTQIPEQTPNGSIWFSVLALGVFCTGLAYILFYRLIMKIGVQQTVTVTYLVPVFSIFYGMVFLGETLTFVMILGCVLVLSGVAITTGRLPGSKV